MIGTLSQFYRIKSFTTFHPVFPEFDFSDWDVTFYPHSNMSAMVVITDPNKPLNGTLPLSRVRPINGALGLRLKKIVYVLLAWSPKKDHVYYQPFTHDFHGSVLFHPDRNLILSGNGPLFKTMPLDDLLEVKQFGAVNGIQFIA